MITNIALNKLVASPRNVRRHQDAEADAQLQADIETRGLLQNLVVVPVAKPKGRYAVEAGERRRRALQSLADAGKLAADFEVSCLVLDEPESGREASLSENFSRLAMNPADECLAFQALVAQGSGGEAIARRFGLTIRFVEGRLRLADLAPVVFEALGAGEIGLDIAKAYAVTSDKERQAWVFEQVGRGYSSMHPDSIRRMMTQASASATDRRALLVGEDAYVAAGGRVERDLFSEGAATRWLDVPLLEKLATEKLDALAAQAAAQTGLAWVRPTLDNWVGHGLLAGLRQLAVEPVVLTEEDNARIAALETEIADLEAAIEDEATSDEARETAEGAVAERYAAIRTIEDRPPVLDPELKAQAGTFLLLADDGTARLHCAYYTERVEEPVDAGAPSTPAGEAGDAGHPEETYVAPTPSAPSLSQRLRDELSMQRRDILAVHVAADPDLARDLAIFLMVDPIQGYAAERSGSSLLARAPSDPITAFETPDAPATIALGQMAAALDRSWGGGATRAERFDAFRALADAARADWLAHAIAGTIEASLGTGSSCHFHDHLAHLLDIDVARWWRPDGVNWFDKVSKAVALEALAQIGGPAFATRFAKAKKAELSEACERIFAGEFVGEEEIKQAALNWLPDVMRFAAPEPVQEDGGAAADAETPPWEELPGQERGGSGPEGGLEEAA